MILSLHYIPNIQYFSKILYYKTVFLEYKEHYQKHSYRNKFDIAGPQGRFTLSVPLIKGKHFRKPIREVEISYAEDWRAVHKKSIYSAYGKAPFFDHYINIVDEILNQQFTYLYELNWHTLKKIMQLLQLDTNKKIVSTLYYEKKPDIVDHRNNIKWPGKPDPAFNPAYYEQVFSDRHGFIPNLSILDVLFCCGPEAVNVIRQSFKKD